MNGTAKRSANYGMTPRRFTPLGAMAQKPLAGVAAPGKDAPETRMARGIRRALWIIALAALVNAGVVALQWYEINKAYVSPAKSP